MAKGIESGLCSNDRLDQSKIHLIFFGKLRNQRVIIDSDLLYRKGKRVLSLSNILFALPDIEFEFRISRTIGEMDDPIFVHITINPC